MAITSPALRYHGAKFRLAPWVLKHFPEHRSYVEPFGGAAGVLLQKPRAYAEVYNDLDEDIANFFRVMRDRSQSDQLIQLLRLTPYARAEFDLAYEDCPEPVERARRTAVRACMGFGSAGATKGVTGFRIDTARPYGTAQHLWTRYPEQLGAVIERFQGVLIENRPAIEVMRQHDTPETLHFVDPPYVYATRSLRNVTQGCYRHEMNDEQHLELLATLKGLQGMVVLSGYPSSLYENELAEWQMSTTGARISAGRGTTIKTEVLWLNPSCQQRLAAPPAIQQAFEI
ncbi:DNA adenine methylase [Comamonas piscis]|uniref:DNA adenine methylase n=1 Tax=Comamonas piscis TaxID=1562974 RepID=A0A7G5EIC3_9BURK|nr:DNA adenine methylase [Comamonas piscis]QMV73748.1 DNA adenine methylase [Comamonas piscis]WSO32172.1 DNA adenine methylase [Comamonas piscis]